jgi:cyclophilin family peptidyl-prolyl cis-trans isomerase
VLTSWKALAAMNLALLIFALGCTRGGDGSQPAAAIGANSSSPTTGANGGTAAKKPSIDRQHPVVAIETSLGNITLRLDADKAPITVGNFLDYVGSGHYDQTIVHQVYKGQGFLAGGYGTNMVEKRARMPIFNEARNGVKNRRGTISMVRSPDAKDSATCQFFINLVDNPALDHKDDTPDGYGYCVFGEVVEGMSVVEAIGAVPVRDTPEFDRTPETAIVVKSIRTLR